MPRDLGIAQPSPPPLAPEHTSQCLRLGPLNMLLPSQLAPTHTHHLHAWRLACPAHHGHHQYQCGLLVSQRIVPLMLLPSPTPHLLPRGQELTHPLAHCCHCWYPRKLPEGLRIGLPGPTNTGVSICCPEAQGQAHSSIPPLPPLGPKDWPIWCPSLQQNFTTVFTNNHTLSHRGNHRHH